MSAKNKNITTLESVLKTYTKNYTTDPYYILFAGYDSKGARIDVNTAIAPETGVTEGEVENNETYLKCINRLTDVLDEYTGIFTIYFADKPLGGAKGPNYAHCITRTFQIGEDSSNSNDIFNLAGIGNTKGSNSNPFMNFMMASAIKGMEGSKSADMARIEAKLEMMELKHRHEKDLEEINSSVGNKIMGIIEDNSDRIFDLVEKVAPVIALKAVGKPSNSSKTTTTRTAQQQEVAATYNVNADWHLKNIDHNIDDISIDQYMRYGAILRKGGINPVVAFAKMCAFYQIDPENFNMASNMMDMKIQEATQNEPYENGTNE